MASNRVPPAGATSATTSSAGIVQLTDSISSTSTTTAATPNAVKSAYDLANGAIAKTLTTTTGDIIYASSANTPARLGIGSSGQVLKVSGGVPAWGTDSSGGLTQLVSATSFGNVNSVTMSSISQDYRDLRVILRNASTVSGGQVRISFNSGGSNGGGYTDFTGTWTIHRTNNGLNYVNLGRGHYFTVGSDHLINIYDYTSTITKFSDYWVSGTDDGSNADAGSFGWFRYGLGAAITSVTISAGSNFDSGTYELWGIK